METKKELCAVFAQFILIILGGVGIGIGTESAWTGAGAALVGVGVASGPLFWTVVDKFIIVTARR